MAQPHTQRHYFLPRFALTAPLLTLALIASLCAILAGCAGKEVTPRALEPERSMAEFSARRLDDPALAAFLTQHGRAPAIWPLARWTLDDLALAALHFHGEYRLALAQQEAAQREAQRSVQAANPQLGIKAEHSDDPSARRPWTLGVELGFAVPTPAKRTAREALADLQSQQARLDTADAAWRLRARVRDRLLDVALAEEEMELARREHALAESEQALLRKRVDVGAATHAELAAAIGRAAELRVAQTRAQARTGDTRVALAAAIGVPPDAIASLQPTTDTFPGDDTLSANQDAYQANALQHRRDIRHGLLEYAQAEAALQLEASGTRDLQWTPGFKWDKGANVWLLGLAFMLPLLHDNSAAIAAAEARREVAARRFETVQQQALAEIRAAWAAWEVQRSARESLRQAFAAHREQLQDERKRFELGGIDRLELVRAERDTLDAQRRLLLARQALRQAAAQLEDAAQQPLDGRGAALDATRRSDSRPASLA